MQKAKNLLLIGAAFAGAAALAAGAAGSLRRGAPAQAQQPQDKPGQGATIRTQVNLVNIFATVRDKSKRIVTDLKQEDFRVFEDNREEKIAFFTKETALPITVGLMIDTSGSEQNRLPAEQEAASRFLARVMRKGDEAMVISFDLDVDLLSDFTEDRAQLDRAIHRARIGAVGSGGVVTPGPLPRSSEPNGTHFYDAVYLACTDRVVSEAGRKALVVITDAEDFGSKVRLEEAIEAAQRTDTVVHVLLVRDPGQGSRPDVAKKIAEETGGRMIEVSSEKKLEESFDQISDELRSQYTLGYYPSNTNHDGGYRKLKIEMAPKNLKVLARRGYYAPKG